MLSREEFNRYNKQVMLEDVGLLGQTMLKEAKVLVIGAGGLGAPLLQYLTSMGVGTIGIVDFDVVEISNLHRQILFTPDDAGMHKVEVTREKLGKQNPYVFIKTYPAVLSEENAEHIFADYDIIVDGCDNFLTRYIVNDTCVKMDKPLVYGSILGYQGQVAVFNYKNSKHLRDLFPEPPNAEDVPNCSENGVMGHVPGIVGLYMCNLVTQLILEHFDQPNTLFLMSLKTLGIRKILF
ncbi:HesA/MoeB/ThiF family protein [Algoriphagus sp. AGSA1]|uniref:HesA/MoeB/ThiF family protein n=1 Tax=Algoriphagus sp. AGSA1 TaxID=2907213 RepID=UPI001F27DC60|nr:HesA/MoeB/ThiF family protein [Algoriphagus sp. AGSA1]MCE7054490.1 HesA/MoeB/ThiF family protein [Algoriphagus sp. AGSA1]